MSFASFIQGVSEQLMVMVGFLQGKWQRYSLAPGSSTSIKPEVEQHYSVWRWIFAPSNPAIFMQPSRWKHSLYVFNMIVILQLFYLTFPFKIRGDAKRLLIHFLAKINEKLLRVVHIAFNFILLKHYSIKYRIGNGTATSATTWTYPIVSHSCMCIILSIVQ